MRAKVGAFFWPPVVPGTLGAHPAADRTFFAVRAPGAPGVTLCLFDDDAERQVPMTRTGDTWQAEVPGVDPGQRYGFRAQGVDPAKLLVDPYALELDRRYAYDPALGRPGVDTAALVPKAIVPTPWIDGPPPPPVFAPGGLIYELNVRGFTMRHPDVPADQRGTVAALAHPAVVAHFRKLGVAAIELMPIVAWIDERHLSPLGLVNAWGYNPVTPMALDPRLCPGGIEELRTTVAALRDAGISVILDLVFNHSGESDEDGPTLSFRGLDPATYARGPDGQLVN
ncbi:MAG: glycogen debranching enzyme, partial [Methylobacterium sp.]